MDECDYGFCEEGKVIFIVSHNVFFVTMIKLLSN